MTERTSTPTIVAEHAGLGVRVTYDTNGDTILYSNDMMDPPCELANALANKLSALTCLMNGDGFEVFDSLCEAHKRDIVWLLDDLAHQICAVTHLARDLYSTARKAEAGARHG